MTKSSPEINEELKTKTEKLLGINGYVINISQKSLSNEQVISYYQELWYVEQTLKPPKQRLNFGLIFKMLMTYGKLKEKKTFLHDNCRKVN